MTEKQIETQILSWLNVQPEIFAFKVNTVGVYDQKMGIYRKNWNRFVISGTADIIGIAYHRFLAIEVKTPVTIKRFKNNPTSADLKQKAFIDQVNKYGGFATVVSSLDDVIYYIGLLKH